MESLISLYKKHLNLPKAQFTFIDHEDDDFCPLEFGEWPAGCKSSFLDGYASIRKVPDYKKMMPLLRLSRAVAAVGFTVKRGTWESRNSKFYRFNLNYFESLAAGGQT